MKEWIFLLGAIIIGVASTGISPEPTFIAVTASVTVNSLVCFKPISIINYPKCRCKSSENPPIISNFATLFKRIV